MTGIPWSAAANHSRPTLLDFLNIKITPHYKSHIQKVENTSPQHTVNGSVATQGQGPCTEFFLNQEMFS